MDGAERLSFVSDEWQLIGCWWPEGITWNLLIVGENGQMHHVCGFNGIPGGSELHAFPIYEPQGLQGKEGVTDLHSPIPYHLYAPCNSCRHLSADLLGKFLQLIGAHHGQHYEIKEAWWGNWLGSQADRHIIWAGLLSCSPEGIIRLQSFVCDCAGWVSFRNEGLLYI